MYLLCNTDFKATFKCLCISENHTSIKFCVFSNVSQSNGLLDWPMCLPGVLSMGLPAENPEPQDTFQWEPKAGEEGEGWGSDCQVETCSPTPLSAGNKKRKKRKRRQALRMWSIVHVAMLQVYCYNHEQLNNKIIIHMAFVSVNLLRC